MTITYPKFMWQTYPASRKYYKCMGQIWRKHLPVQSGNYSLIPCVFTPSRISKSPVFFLIGIFFVHIPCLSCFVGRTLISVIGAVGLQNCSDPHLKNESMVSFVSSRYMRVVNGSLMVCLAYSNRKTKCQNYRKMSRN